ncbi:hypothetical protein Ddye_031725 [Dipteronia dyeriana]|uniref:Dirigent protein n=1 Tax=Dipteronia dyeriana TaxID=168575 RepID=A0AAD9WNY0_9ROSI|nr:hypothetical protein Ddye_031725 [Dipteronia dyeriana]
MPPSFTYTLCFILFSACLSTTNGDFCEEITEGITFTRFLKMSHLHFYFHDIVSGKNATAVRIAGPPNSTAYGFGSTVMIDDPLTDGPDLTSKLVGRAQGMYAIASQRDISLLLVMNLAFLDGKYNGSSISILGRNPVFDDVREMPIVGGSGVFRSAHGYALAHTILFDYNTGDAIVEYNVYVTHG